MNYQNKKTISTQNVRGIWIFTGLGRTKLHLPTTIAISTNDT